MTLLRFLSLGYFATLFVQTEPGVTICFHENSKRVCVSTDLYVRVFLWRFYVGNGLCL